MCAAGGIADQGSPAHLWASVTFPAPVEGWATRYTPPRADALVAKLDKDLPIRAPETSQGAKKSGILGAPRSTEASAPVSASWVQDPG